MPIGIIIANRYRIKPFFGLVEILLSLHALLRLSSTPERTRPQVSSQVRPSRRRAAPGEMCT
ncbi:MAG: hypothetical protein V3R80_12935, partial [Candidatus Tectomicrobia bacterium]